jgi:NifU-like protein involved in Fe-S cluster formation
MGVNDDGRGVQEGGQVVCAGQWVCEGPRPNLTLQQLETWVNEKHNIEVCTSAISMTWDFDGDDVVEDRKTHLATIASGCGHTHSPQSSLTSSDRCVP